MRKEGFSPDLAREVNYYTIEWFIEHIRVADLKLVEFINQKTIEDKSIPVFLKKVYTSFFGKTN